MEEPISSPNLANRLARAIASDIALYSEAKIIHGIMSDTLFDDIAEELKEGRALYQKRVSKEIDEQFRFFDRAVVDLIFKMKGEQVDSPIW